MKFIFLFLLLFFITACTEDAPADNSSNAPTAFTPIQEKHNKAKIETIGILYLQEQILESWIKNKEDHFSLSVSAKINITDRLSIGSYSLQNKKDHWQLDLIDSFYPFAPSPPILLDPEQKIGFHFVPENNSPTILSQVNQLYIVPSRITENDHFSSPFGAGPQQIAQYQYLEKELKKLHLKQSVPE